jgi:arylformamidase
VPSDLVRTGVAISGIFDLEPLIDTSINRAIGLDRASARAVSPRFWPPPSRHPTLLAVVGEHEGAEFHRQCRDLVSHWRRAGVQAECLEVPGANHFSVIDQLAGKAHPLYARVVALATDESSRADKSRGQTSGEEEEDGGEGTPEA